jgi:hypothetical protein
MSQLAFLLPLSRARQTYIAGETKKLQSEYKCKGNCEGFQMKLD